MLTIECQLGAVKISVDGQHRMMSVSKVGQSQNTKGLMLNVNFKRR